MPDRLTAGQRLQMKESLVSASGEYSLVLQDDRNLVIYSADGSPIWATDTTA